MSGSEYTKSTIRHHVYAMCKLFGIDPTSDSDMCVFADRLEKSISASSLQVSARESVDALCDGNPQAEVFVRKYEELKLRNVKELCPLIYLCSRIKYDSTVLPVLESISQAKVSAGLAALMGSPDVGLEGKGVDQLQQLIADSGASTMPYISNDQLRGTVGASMDSLSFPDLRTSGFPVNVSASGTLVRRDSSDSSQTRQSEILQRGPFTSVRRTVNLPKLPPQPDWVSQRINSWDDFLPPLSGDPEDFQKVPIETLSNALQANAVVGDLLQCLQGNRGVYIKPLPLVTRSSVQTFQVDDRMSPALLDTVNKILPICSDYSMISRFIGEQSMFEHGYVNQALASGMRKLTKDYMVLICQLEHQYKLGELTIAKLKFFLQETATVFTQLARIAADISTANCAGGAVLSLLHNTARTVYGVKQMHELMNHLLIVASVPFFKILQKWIYRGVISDPYQEFFIVAGPMPEFLASGRFNPSTPSHVDRMAHEYVDWALFWESHYSIVSMNLPTFLESHVTKILNTGKYLNVVQQCKNNGGVQKAPEAVEKASDQTAESYDLPELEELQYDEDDSHYLSQIENAYLYSSSLLLKLMIRQKDLKEHLKSIKRYFLLDKADFIVHFMDAAAKELSKPSTEVSLFRLGSLLELAIRTSTATVDPFKDNLKVVLFKYDLITHILMVLRAASDLEQGPNDIEDMNLTGLEAFCVDYSVDWPISLVLNRQVLDRYQMLFRHLFYCKHVERLLCSAWVLGKLARRTDTLMSTWFTTAFLLSQRMLTFIQHFQYYMAVEVIEPTWDQFFNQVSKVSNLDALLDAHLYCLEVCMDDCLLASPDLLSLFGKLSVVCVLFANFIQHVLMGSVGGAILSGSDSGSSIPDARSLLQDPTPSALSIWSADGTPNRPSSRMSQAASTVSHDTVLTKVTREDFNQIGSSEAFGQTVINFDRKFNSLLVDFLEKIRQYSKERNKLSSLVSRLDFNEFYSGHWSSSASPAFNPATPPPQFFPSTKSFLSTEFRGPGGDQGSQRSDLFSMSGKLRERTNADADQRLLGPTTAHSDEEEDCI
ncbi:unnamed protein product [Calicophoron daubneyi]|uniref:Gamma-tubulin complex component n=1 Tax=Calicophoron daubneyi TaxID=300641 RepID=A0AAV2TB68_CALDB